MRPCRRQVLRSVFTVTVVYKALWVVMYTMNNHTTRQWSLTTDLQSTVSKLKTPHKAFGDIGWSSKEALWDVLQCSKAVAKFGLHYTVKVAYSSV